MFKLNIESSRDIDELHIVFSDGSSMVTTGSKESKKPAKSKPKPKKSPKAQTSPADDFDFEEYLDNSSISQEIVEKPKIDIGNRPVNVDSGLQNLDI